MVQLEHLVKITATALRANVAMVFVEVRLCVLNEAVNPRLNSLFLTLLT